MRRYTVTISLLGLGGRVLSRSLRGRALRRLMRRALGLGLRGLGIHWLRSLRSTHLLRRLMRLVS